MDVVGYSCHRVIESDDASLIVRTCLQRPSGKYFAVGYVERVPFEGDEDKLIDDIVTPLADLKFTTEDAALWTWFADLQTAVDASKATFAPYTNWSAGA